MSPSPTQCQKVIDHIEEHGHITSFEAFLYLRITRLSAVIFELKKKYPIERTMVYTRNEDGTPTHYAIYSLRKEAS